MQIVVINNHPTTTRYEDSFDSDDTSQVQSPISTLEEANLCIYINGLLVGRLDYFLDRHQRTLKGRNFNRNTVNRFEKQVLRRYGLDQYWLGVLTDV